MLPRSLRSKREACTPGTPVRGGRKDRTHKQVVVGDVHSVIFGGIVVVVIVVVVNTRRSCCSFVHLTEIVSFFVFIALSSIPSPSD